MKISVSQTVFDKNSEEQIEFFINGKSAGTYTLGTYSRWYLQRVDRGERSIPDVGRFVAGLLRKTYGIDVYAEDGFENAAAVTKCKTIGEWFEKYMEENEERAGNDSCLI